MKKKSNKFDSESLRADYVKRMPSYERLAVNLQQALKGFLEEANISYLDVDFRTKEFSSFEEKILRKNYENPFDDCEDFCGIRVICYYPTDVEKICDIIRNEFTVHQSEDKSTLLGVHEFGYRSTHFIVSVNPEWLIAPNYRGLDDLKAEIQVRTILMHAWAEIEHKLAYKKQEQVPDAFKRKLSRLSAKFEEADEQFEELRNGLHQYRQKLADDAKTTGRFDPSVELNLDTLRAFLEFTFPDRSDSSIQHVRNLLEDLKTFNITIKELMDYVEQSSGFLGDFEQQINKIFNLEQVAPKVTTLERLLFLCHQGYRERFAQKFPAQSSKILKATSDIIEKVDGHKSSGSASTKRK